MLMFDRLSGNGRGFVLLWSVLVLLILFYCFIRSMQQRRGGGALVPAAALMADYLLLQVMIAISEAGQGTNAERGFALPVPYAILSLAALTAIAAALLRSIDAWRKTHITAMSVRQAFNDLPAGICWFWPGGLPKLTNSRMEAVCRAVTGRALSDAEAFWDDLRQGRVRSEAESIRVGEHPIVRLPDGGVYSFRLRETALEGRPIYELAALDVTQEYEVSLGLREKRTRAEGLNLRLRELNKTITAMTVEKETLAAKTRLHDEFGTALLMARRYLLESERSDRAELLALWRRVDVMLKDAGPNKLQGEYIDVLRAAYLLGAEIEIDGALPELPPMRELAALAISTCLANTLRHAQGTHVFVCCERKEAEDVITIQNDGRQPERTIVEGGGLGDLRRRLEDVGGTMRVDVRERFTLTVTIPREVGTDGERADR